MLLKGLCFVSRPTRLLEFLQQRCVRLFDAAERDFLETPQLKDHLYILIICETDLVSRREVFEYYSNHPHF